MITRPDQIPPALFDRQLLLARRARNSGNIDRHDFLLRRAAEDIGDRLAAITREFPVAISLGGRHGLIGDILRKQSGISHVVEADSSPELLAMVPRPKLRCDEELLPFRESSIDLVVSGLTLHFVNDLPGTLVQIKRALKPDGLFMAALMGGRTLFELREVFMLAEEELENGISPHIAPMAEIRDCGALLQRAGFALPVADADIVTVTYKTAFDLLKDLRGMGAGNILHARRHTPMRRETLMRMAQLYQERFGQDGRIPATFEIIHIAGWAPHHSQPKPLKPGSARQRLGDVLQPDKNR